MIVYTATNYEDEVKTTVRTNKSGRLFVNTSDLITGITLPTTYVYESDEREKAQARAYNIAMGYPTNGSCNYVPVW